MRRVRNLDKDILDGGDELLGDGWNAGYVRVDVLSHLGLAPRGRGDDDWKCRCREDDVRCQTELRGWLM